MQRSWKKNPWIIGGIVFLAVCTVLCLFPFGLFKLAGTKTSSTQSASTKLSPTKTQEPTSTPKATHVPTRTQTSTSTLPPTPLPVGAAYYSPSSTKGQACVIAAGELSCLDSSTWRTIPLDFVKEYSYVYDLAACPDGQLLVGHYEGASLWDGKTWSQLYKPSSGIASSINQVACSADGIKWVAENGFSNDGIVRFSSSNQEKFKFEQILAGTGVDTASGYNTVQDMAITPDGYLWVLIEHDYSDKSYLIYFDGTSWYNISNAPQALLKLAYTSKGQIWAIDESKVYQYTTRTWKEFPSEDDVLSDLFIDTDDRVWFSTHQGNVLVLDQGTWFTYAATDGERISDGLTTLAIDGQGRLWVGSTWGLYVFDGNLWKAYEMTNSDIADYSISAIAVFDGGPDLPALVKKEMGSASGIVKQGDVKIRFAEVEVCQKHFGQFITYYGTPCDGERLYHSTFTSAEGIYRFDDLPPGYYSSFYKVANEGWEFGPVFTIEAGKEIRVEDIEVEEE
jgi:ligand-binding sensor domain-containing protein